MSKAPTTAEPKKRGRPKGSRNRPKATEGLKYGDPNFKKRPVERDLTPEELMLLCAEWQRTRKTERAAKAVGITEAHANDIVVEYIKKHPEVIESPDLLLRMGITMGEIQAMAVDRAKENMTDVWGKAAVMTAWIAGQRSEKYYAAWKEKMGAAATEDVGKLGAEAEAVDAELARLEEEPTPTGQGDTETAPAQGETAGIVGEDADARQGPTGGTD